MKEIRRLTKADVDGFVRINEEIDKVIANPDWFHPFTRETAEFFFGEKNTHVIYGCFVDGVLAGVSLFDYDNEQCKWLTSVCNLPENKKYAEVGGSMVLPAYRGQNIMFELNKALKEKAKEQGIDCFVATAHPDNIASNSSLKKLGLQFVTTGINPNGIIRNLYVMDL